MGKTKKIKSKTTGFDIMYRVITAVMAVAVFPAVYFSDLVYYELDHSALSGILELFGSDAMKGSTYGTIRLSALGDGTGVLSSVIGEDFSLSMITSNPVYRPVIAAAVLLALALVLALVIIGFAVFSNKVKVITALSGSSLALMLGALYSFTAFFASPIKSGEIALTQLFGIEDDMTALIMSFVGKVSALQLDDAFYSALFLMIAIFIWSVSVVIVNAGEKKANGKIKAKIKAPKAAAK